MAPDTKTTATPTSSDEAIALVLRHEQSARQAIEAARAEALQIAETARADARAVAARVERRIARAAEASEHASREQTAALDAEAAAVAQAHVLTAQDHERLSRAVQALADELARGAA